MKVPPHLCWPVWRLVLAGIAGLVEIENWWTVGMVLDANDALDLQQEAERLMTRKAQE